MVGKIYRLCTKLGKGSFGEVFQGVNTKTGSKVAIKLERMRTECAQLEYESKIYENFKDK